MLRRCLSNPNFLVIYSAVVTIAFITTTFILVAHPVLGASKISEFDRIRVHRIDVVEPDGTPRLILSNRTDYPGSFYHGHEIDRPDRRDSAGMLFINDEGTEDGGLIYGGTNNNGKPESFGHLSFDQYEQDQTVTFGTQLSSNGEKSAGITLNDMPDYPLSPDLYAESARIRSMPHGAERAAAWAALMKRYPPGQQRAYFARSADGTVGLALKDAQGHVRLKLAVSNNGDPSINFLDEKGQVKRSILIQGDSGR
jgi:hypothetical protein